MNTTNTISVVLGMMQKIATRAIYQTDSGWRLMVKGHNLPATLQADFANTTTGENAVTFTFNTAEGVEVPASLIRQGRDIHAYIVLTSEAYSITRYDITIPVNPRAIIADDPTPEQRSYIDEAVETCTDAARQCAENVRQYPRIVGGVWQVYNAVTGRWTDTGVPATGPQGPQGVKGEKGDDGTVENLSVTAEGLEPGATPTANYVNNLLTLGIPKGERGLQGERGATGPKGDPGDDGTIENLSVAAEALPAGSEPTATYEGNLLTLGIPGAEMPLYSVASVGTDWDQGSWEIRQGETRTTETFEEYQLARGDYYFFLLEYDYNYGVYKTLRFVLQCYEEVRNGNAILVFGDTSDCYFDDRDPVQFPFTMALWPTSQEHLYNVGIKIAESYKNTMGELYVKWQRIGTTIDNPNLPLEQAVNTLVSLMRDPYADAAMFRMDRTMPTNP